MRLVRVVSTEIQKTEMSKIVKLLKFWIPIIISWKKIFRLGYLYNNQTLKLALVVSNDGTNKMLLPPAQQISRIFKNLKCISDSERSNECLCINFTIICIFVIIIYMVNTSLSRCSILWTFYTGLEFWTNE